MPTTSRQRRWRTARAAACAFFSVALVPFLPCISLGDNPPTIVTVDRGTMARVGESSSHLIVNGNPAVAYYNASKKQLQFIRATDVNGTTWSSPVVVDATGFVGQYCSLRIINGNPAISYYDATGGYYGTLKYVRATDVNGATWGTPVSVDSNAGSGQYTSLQTVNGNPAISYYDGANEILKYVRASDANGASWGSALTVDPEPGAGYGTSLQVVNGNPAIAYYSLAGSGLLYIRATNANGTAWGTRVVADTHDAGFTYFPGIDPTMQVIDGKPAISYGEINANKLVYVRANDVSGTSWSAPVVITPSGGGRNSSLQVVNGNPAIAFAAWDGGQNSTLKYVRAADIDGVTWNPVVTMDTAGGNTGLYASLQVVNGRPAVSYEDVYSGDLKYVRASNADGSGSWGSPATIDNGGNFGDVGFNSSQAIVNGRPAISYADGENGLKYVRALDAVGSTWGTPITIDAGHFAGFGSTLLVINGNPAIAYHDSNYGRLRFVRATNADGTAWGSPITLDNDGTYGSSMKIVNGNPAISYVDLSFPGRLKYIRANDINGAGWSGPVTLVGGGSDSHYLIDTSLEVVNGNPAICFSDATNFPYLLQYVRATNNNGTSWGAPVTIANDSEFSSLAIVAGNPAISYNNFDDGTQVFQRATDINGTAWGAPIVLESDVGGTDRNISSLQIINGNPAVAFYDASNGVLKYKRATNAAGSHWSGTLIVDNQGGAAGQYASMRQLATKIGVSYREDNRGDLRYASFDLPPLCAAPPAGLVGWWPGEGDARNIFICDSGCYGGNDGTTGAGVTFTDAEVGAGFTLNGNFTNSRVSIPDNNGDFNASRFIGFTVDFWMKGNAGQTATIVEKTDGATAGWWFETDSADNKLRFRLGGSTGNTTITSDAVVLDGNFHHVAAVLGTDAVMRMYIDGVAQSQTATKLDGGGNERPINIGWLGVCQCDFFVGTVDELQVFQAALTATQIQGIVTAGGAGLCRSCTLQFDGNTPIGYEDPNFGSAGYANVRRTGAIDDSATIDYATIAGGTATGGASCSAGVDYINTAGTLTFAAYDTFKQITVPVCDDTVFEPGGETVNLQVSNVTGSGASLGSPSAATMVIYDNDCVDPPSGMVAWYPGDDNFEDIQGPTFENGSQTGGVLFTTGLVGDAFSFDGVNDKVTIADSAALHPNDFTYDAWIYPDGSSPAGDNYVISKGVVGSYFPLIYITGPAGSHHWAAIVDSVTLTGSSVNYYWQHVAVTRQGNVGKLYVDGVLQDTRTVGTGTGTGLPLALGNISNSNTSYFKGALDEVEVFNRALTDTEIGNIVSAYDHGKCKHGLIQFDAANYSVGEAGGTVTVTVNRADGGVGAASVHYATSNGTATAGSDYTAASGDLNWADGDNTSRTFPISVTEDNVYEGDETINITLSSVTGSQLGPQSTSTITITDNDTPPTLSIDSVSHSEGNSSTTSYVFTVTKTGGTTASATVNFATQDVTATVTDGDYAANSGALTFLPNDTTKTITVLVSGDTKFETNEAFKVHLSGATNATIATADGAGTITNDDTAPTLQFSAATYSVNENGGTATLTVTKTGSTALNATVHYATSNGTATAGSDYTATSGDLTFLPGDTSKTISVTIADDTVYEGDETFTVDLSAPANATLGTPSAATVTITENEAAPSVQFSAATYNVNENGTNATLTVTKTGSTALNATVHYATSNGTATAGSDYTATSGDLTFLPNEISKDISVPIADDSVYEGNEAFAATLSAPANATLGTPSAATVTITENDAAPTLQFTAANYSVNENGTSVTVTVTKTGSTALAATVHYATVNGTATAGSDYTATSGDLTFAPNETSKDIVVSIADDTVYEGDETFTVALTSPGSATVGTPGTATVTIVENEAAPTVRFSSATYSVNENGGTAMLTITKSGSTALNATVHYATSNGTATAGSDYTAASSDVTFLPNETSKNVTVSITDDSTYEGNEDFTVGLSSPVNATLGSPSSATVTIVEDDGLPLVQFGAATYSVGEGDGTVTLTVTRTGTTAVPATVHYATSNDTATAGSDYTAASGDLTFLPNDTSKTIVVSITDDSVYEGSEAFKVTLSSPAGASLGSPNPATVTITENDAAPVVQFNPAAYSVNEEAGTVTLTITKSGSTGVNATVHYQTVDGTATAPSDYANTSGNVTFLPGDTSKDITVPIIDDNIYEAAENFTLALSSPVASTIGSASTATVTILVNDTAPEIAVEQPTGVDLTTGSTVSFVVRTSTALTKTFKIRNLGTGDLTGIALTKTGTNAADFAIDTTGMATTLAPSASTTFTVTFTPSADGNRSAALHIASNDADENPFDINLSGRGLTAIEAWRLQYFGDPDSAGPGADSNDFDNDGLSNVLEYATDSDPTQSSPPPGVLVINGTNLEFTYNRSKAALTDGFIFAVQWSDSLKVPNWNSVGVIESVVGETGTAYQIKAVIPEGNGKSRFVRLHVTPP